MSQNTSKEQEVYGDFLDTVGGWAQATIHRGDGTVEGPNQVFNQVTAGGLNNLAARAIVTSYSPFNAIAIGSGTAAGSLGSTALINQVSSKQANILTTSRSTMILSNTWGGAADSITSIALQEAAIFNDAGVMLNSLTGVAATLADSDLLNLEMVFQIGSHAE